MNKSSYLRMLLAGIVLLASCAELQAQSLRQSVCVVYPEFSKEDSVLLTKYAMLLYREGKPVEARETRSHARGSFGSGVVTDACVLTNRHVIQYARTAKLVFVLPDTTLTYEHCPILSASVEMDLAAISLPADHSLLASLPLSSKPVIEDEDVTAAGFPGLAGQPSWQLTRGSVSNAHLTLPDEKRRFIQHTAAIDPGSSGGPLLRKNDEGYEVLGLNTLKAFTREQVGIAVPNKEVRDFLSALGTPDTSDFAMMDTIKERLREEDEMIEESLSAPGIEPELRDRWLVSLSEDWMIPGEHMLGVNIDAYSTWYILGGFSLSVPLVPHAGFAGGFRFGGFIPIRLNESSLLVPQATAGVQVGVLFPKTGPMVYIPVRAGIDYRYEFSKTTLMIGVGYIFRPTVNAMESGSFAMKHGVSFQVGVAF